MGARTKPSWASSPAVRARMQRQRTSDTAPELALRRLLHAAGLRYRVNYPPLKTSRRRADVVFTRVHVAVFVDGCFWHGCPIHGTRKFSTNKTYWEQKIQRNRQRDADTDKLLKSEGWLSIRCWEHDDPRKVAEVVVREVIHRRKGLEHRGARR